MEPEPTSPAKLLVVDDHVDTQRMIAWALRSAGYRVSTAGDFEAALGMARSERFDLPMTDVGLPGKDGFDLLAEVAKIYSIRAIVLSGYDAGRVPPPPPDAPGGFRFVQKPVGLEALLSATAEELARPRPAHR